MHDLRLFPCGKWPGQGDSGVCRRDFKGRAKAPSQPSRDNPRLIFRRRTGIGEAHNPVGEEENQRAQRQRRQAEGKEAEAGGLVAGVALIDGQQIFRKVFHAAPDFPQPINENEKSSGAHDDAEQFRWFHAGNIEFGFAGFGKQIGGVKAFLIVIVIVILTCFW